MSSQVRINNMGSIGRYYYFVKNTEALAKLQARLEMGKSPERSSEVQTQEADHNMELEGG